MGERAIDRFGREAVIEPRTREQNHAAQKYASPGVATDDPRLKGP